VYPKYRDYAGTFGVKNKIEGINKARQEKETVLKKPQITRYIKIVRSTDRYTHKCQVEEDSGTKIE
jgi:hypothetical protein